MTVDGGGSEGASERGLALTPFQIKCMQAIYIITLFVGVVTVNGQQPILKTAGPAYAAKVEAIVKKVQVETTSESVSNLYYVEQVSVLTF